MEAQSGRYEPHPREEELRKKLLERTALSLPEPIQCCLEGLAAINFPEKAVVSRSEITDFISRGTRAWTCLKKEWVSSLEVRGAAVPWRILKLSPTEEAVDAEGLRQGIVTGRILEIRNFGSLAFGSLIVLLNDQAEASGLINLQAEGG